MRVAVTGAGGYVGRALVGALLARRDSVTALDLRGPRLAFPEAVRFLAGDVRDAGALRALVRDSDAVAHLAAYVHRAAETRAARAECFAVNEGATRALVAEMAATGRRPHLVLVSTVAVYGATFERAVETAEPRPVTAYGASKLAAERIVLEAAARGAITGCVLRPAVVYGPGAPGNTGGLVSLVRRGMVPLVGGGANAKSLVHVDDLAAALVRAIETPERANGRVFNVAGEPLSVRAMVETIARGAGVRARWLPAPRWAFATAGGLAHALSRATGGRLPDLGRSLEVFAGTATADASAVVRELGVRFRPSADGIEEMARLEAGR